MMASSPSMVQQTTLLCLLASKFCMTTSRAWCFRLASTTCDRFNINNGLISEVCGYDRSYQYSVQTGVRDTVLSWWQPQGSSHKEITSDVIAHIEIRLFFHLLLFHTPSLLFLDRWALSSAKPMTLSALLILWRWQKEPAPSEPAEC